VRRFALVAAVAAGLATATASSALANHSWNGYHWARPANPFTVPLGDNVSNTAYSNWDGALAGASSDWTRSTVLDAPVVPQSGNARSCKGIDGRIRVCNARYGYNGWLGLATVWLSGSHIVRATTKVNDSYFDSPSYSYTNERHVMCQEVGHGFGLDHQDTSGADLNTCMDYSTALDNPSPNAHDYEELEIIYNSHVDSGAMPTFSPPSTKPLSVTRTDTIATSHIVTSYGHGYRIHMFVTWAVGG
jgi:hypothetical protein